MERTELMALLPHRQGMLLLDRAEVREGEAYGEKLIRGDEWFLQGHFPNDPVTPGVILCEILAQSACVLLPVGQGAAATPMFSGIDKARFKRPVRPGELFRTQCRILRHKGPFYFAAGQGFVGDDLCLEAEFSFALVKK